MKKNIKNLFSIFKNNPNLIYLDNSATTQKPDSVIDAMSNFYKNSYANIHRGLYPLSNKTDELYNETRSSVAKFINAKTERKIIFTHGTTDSINLLAFCFNKILNDGDEIIISQVEHHSNFLPWYNLKSEKNINFKFLPVNEYGEFDYNWLQTNITDRTKLISITGQSNVFGHITDIKKITDIAHIHGIKVVIDAAQLVAHKKIDVIKDDIDFLAFSSHKMYGSTGLGILYGKKELLDELPPYQLGGDMVESVDIDRIIYNKSPSRFEAGTPPIAEVIGLKEAIKFVNDIGIENISSEEKELTLYTIEQLKKIKDIKIISHPDSIGIVSFIIPGISSFDIGALLGVKNICVRVGKHCAELLHKNLCIDSSIRVSLAIYNDKNDIDVFIQNLINIISILK